MSTLPAEGPNAEQIRYWNEAAAPKWVELQRLLDAQIGPLGQVAMDRAAPAPGESVLDLGCGCGATTLELARRVGPTGSVLAVDISAPMLAVARRDAERAGARHVRFENADAQTHDFAPASVDLAFSRFGVMFFIDPTAAFANIRRAVRPGGRLAFVCWQGLPLNPWMAVPMAAAMAHVQFTPPPSPHAPGPFAFADADRVRGILEGAGFVEVAIEPHGATLTIGSGGIDAAADFLVQMGPTGTALREASDAARAEVVSAVRASLEPYATPEGVRMDSATWIVTARQA
jgi:SAM-dependent methyltransferase